MIYPDVYEGQEPYIFISYAHKDETKVIPLIRGLIERGYRVWYDKGMKNMNKVVDWPTCVGRHLLRSHCVIAFVSQNAAESLDCRKEMRMSIEQKKNPLVIRMGNIALTEETVGMELEVGGLHYLRYEEYESDNTFFDALTEYRVLQAAKFDETRLPEYQNLTPEECNRKGKAYERGIGVNQNWELAAAWYRRAAEEGLADAQYTLGWCYDNGKGVPMDWNQAAAWYRRAAAQGHQTAILVVSNII